jgi:ActR/RegA family two-component response regulator
MNQVQETGHGEGYDRPRVLIMEDEMILAKGLAMVMRDEGYHVDLADTGRGALEQFQKSDFDLLVADLRLPDINGMEVVEQVRGNKPETNVVIITGYPTVASNAQAVKLGVSDYLRKPFTEDEFMKAVKSSLGERRMASMRALLVETQQERLIQREEVLRVLDRTFQDKDFWRELAENGSQALKDYQVSSEAKAAIVFGDLNWIQKNIGRLSEKQLAFIHKRLEREVW